MRFCLSFIFALLLPLAGLAGNSPRPGLMDEAFQAAQWGFLSSAGSALSQTGQRRASGDDALAALLRERQSLADLLLKTEAALATLADPDAASARIKATRLGGEIDALNAEISAADQRIAADFPGFSRLTRPGTLSITEVQRLLEPGEGMVFAFTGVIDSFVWAITKQGAAWHRIGIGRDGMADTVAAIRRSLEQASLNRGAEPLAGETAPRITAFDRTSAWLAYSELLAPLEQQLAGVQHLYSVLDGPLSGLPLALLVTDATIKGDDSDPAALRQTGWLFQRHALTTLPSVESLAAIRDTVAHRPPDGQLALVGFGDPSFTGSARPTSTSAVLRSGTADPEAIRALAPLPNTGPELRRIAATLGAENARLYLGADATETALKSAPLAQARVIAFATHGLLSGDLQGLAEPALVLTPPDQPTPGDDGLLTASEVAALDLTADWVVLSACNTAGSDGRPDAEGLSGLARAFLFAGARTIMVSHWPVRDDAAARLTSGTFTALADAGSHRRKAEALQQAMQRLLDDESDPSLAHPAAWAPFVIVGDGGY